MNTLRPFQIVLLGVFGLFAIIGLFYFGFYRGGDDAPAYASGVTIWGTLSQGSFNDVLDTLADEDDAFAQVYYVQKSTQTFNVDLLNAIAEGYAPDLIVLPSDQIVTHRAKLFSIPYESIPERTYRERYVDGADVYLFTEGSYGLPFAVDPLVMYWNRDMFSTNGLASYPRTWESVVSEVVPALTRRNGASLSRSAIAFGEYANITHAKSILTLLLLQSGTSIATGAVGGGYEVTLGNRIDDSLPPAQAALSFYTQFALPTSAAYSWNRTFASDRSAFTSGILGLYFGKGSEYVLLEQTNPNLNFDIAPVPQGATANAYRGQGTFYAFAIPRASGNSDGAYAVMQVLAEPNQAVLLADAFGMAPVHRSVIAAGTTDAIDQVRYRAALIARTWLDPDANGSAEAFRLMIEDVTSGRSRVGESVEDGIDRLELLF